MLKTHPLLLSFNPNASTAPLIYSNYSFYPSLIATSFNITPVEDVEKEDPDLYQRSKLAFQYHFNDLEVCIQCWEKWMRAYYFNLSLSQNKSGAGPLIILDT